MAQDKLDTLGPIMNEIGQELANIADGDPEGVFLYVEAGEGWVAQSVFKDEGMLVRYLDSNQTDLVDLLFEAWRAQPEGKRWSVMGYAIEDGHYSVSFKYPEEIDVDTMDPKHREDALRARYGDQPVGYPPMPEGAFELKP